MQGTVKREELLAQLNSVRGGLTSKEIIEQSSCLCFRNGRVMTYNDEVACTNNCDLDITGAVTAEPVLAILEKRKDETLQYAVEEGVLKFRGKRGTTEVAMQQQVSLPIDNVEYPEKSAWRKLPEGFEEAISAVQECAGKDESRFSLTCIHIHPEWVETCNNFEVYRFRIETGVEQPILIRRDALKHIISLGVTKFAETDTWMHYKNPSGLIMSVRRHIRDDFPDLTNLLNVKGTKLVLPKSLVDAVECCEVFSSQNVDNNTLKVRLEPGQLLIEGRGVTGKHSEPRKLDYTGKPLVFRVSPQTLANIIRNYNQCQVTEVPDTSPSVHYKLKVNGSNFTYVACLVAPKKKNQSTEEE